jgi:hypothetical protein
LIALDLDAHLTPGESVSGVDDGADRGRCGVAGFGDDGEGRGGRCGRWLGIEAGEAVGEIDEFGVVLAPQRLDFRREPEGGGG